MPICKLTALRNLMSQRNISAYIIPSGDSHASEYVADYFRSREWLSGFTGSAGLVVVTQTDAGLWTDGRYFAQAEQELQNSGITLYKSGEPDVPTYQAFLQKLGQGIRVGFDGRVITISEFEKLKSALKSTKATFMYNEDLVGQIWQNRPQMPAQQAFAHEPPFATTPATQKLSTIREKMREKKITAYLVSALDSVAWLLNIRGSDINSLPVAYAHALVTETDAHVFIDPAKAQSLVASGHFSNFTLHPYDALPKFLRTLKTQKLYYNPARTNVLLAEAVPKAADASKYLKPHEDIIPLLKAVKTSDEISNIKNAFIKEGIVLVKMLKWLDDATKVGQPLTEGDVVRILQSLRAKQPHYLCDSFDTIAAYGKNAALAHYSPSEQGVALAAQGFLLIDTGGQYLDGTTDTTRTVCLGEITDEMRRDFTLVLKGHIGLARAVFPSGTVGSSLDILARLPLWESGQNFRHGTGHGLGYCLSVHEGPQNIAPTWNAVALAPGMLLSNEPAIYKENYGIRTENILLVTEQMKTNDGTFFAFETLTHCPIDTRAVLPELLTQVERYWLNSYHTRTREVLSPHLTDAEREWLRCATETI